MALSLMAFRHFKGLSRSLLAVAAAPAFLLASCASFEESGLPGSASSMARNQIMLVREDPPTFGFYRLNTQTRIYPDLGIFITRRGMPDFLAETHSGSQHYFILYYLNQRQAFACRSRAARPRNLEFAGPYPITPREFKMLNALKQNPPD